MNRIMHILRSHTMPTMRKTAVFLSAVLLSAAALAAPPPSPEQAISTDWEQL